VRARRGRIPTKEAKGGRGDEKAGTSGRRRGNVCQGNEETRRQERVGGAGVTSWCAKGQGGRISKRGQGQSKETRRRQEGTSGGGVGVGVQMRDKARERSRERERAGP
jgi:hypothetical protein